MCSLMYSSGWLFDYVLFQDLFYFLCHNTSYPHFKFSLFDFSTPIFTGDGEGGSGFAAAAAAAAAGGVSGFDFGVDPNLDPELALALRVSMEEERARQEAAAKKAAEENTKQEKGAEQPSGSQDATMTERSGLATSDAENKAADLMVMVSVAILC